MNIPTRLLVINYTHRKRDWGETGCCLFVCHTRTVQDKKLPLSRASVDLYPQLPSIEF